jgi:hydroxymethylbilane synthase
MQSIRLTGRKSKLSLYQIELVRKAIKKAKPDIKIEIAPMDSLGDLLKEVPLLEIISQDFFTESVSNTLKDRKADIAVHSLKDVSGQHVFSHHSFAIVEREDPRDIAIFNPGIMDKIFMEKSIRIGTSSLRRKEMAIFFLADVMPGVKKEMLYAKSIRGNIEERLEKLRNGDYDGIILATAGLNRLLNDDANAEKIKALLHGTHTMLLPLIECVPAPGQGALLAEANPENVYATNLIDQINNTVAFEDSMAEKKIALRYGNGCDMRFGVTTIYYDNYTKKSIYSAGIDKDGDPLQDWHGLPDMPIEKVKLFNSANYMARFQKSIAITTDETITADHVFVASKNAISSKGIIQTLKQKKVWAAGTHTWKALAKAGIWVSGCADGLGLEQMKKVWEMPLLKINPNEIIIITQQNGSAYWTEKGWKTITTYQTDDNDISGLQPELNKCNFFFWTNAFQYLQCKPYLPEGEIYHACPSGATANQLRNLDVNPIIFPTIQSLKFWCNKNGL